MAAPRTPYPPDPGDDEPEPLADPLVDVVVAGADWANRRAPRLELRRVELRGVRLTGAELGESRLTDVVFADCRLDLAGLRFAQLERVVFRDCRLEECDLYEAALKDVLFEGCALREATLSGARLERVELRGCDLLGLRGFEALRGVRMPWLDVVENAAGFAAALGIEVVE
jgi:uncharacterized protein YjbI with pentapeptide repeats